MTPGNKFSGVREGNAHPGAGLNLGAALKSFHLRLQSGSWHI